MSKHQDHVWSEFDFVLNCTARQEQASLGEDSKFASYLFWEDDLLAPNFGLAHARPLPKHSHFPAAATALLRIP